VGEGGTLDKDRLDRVAAALVQLEHEAARLFRATPRLEMTWQSADPQV
jgi:hypothetical protein